MKKTVSTIAIATGISLMGVAVALAGDITEKRDLSSFEKITIDDTAVGIDVMVGEEFSVTLKGAEKWIKRISTKVEGNTLILGRTNYKKKNMDIGSDDRVIITMPKLTALKVDGAVDAEITGVDSKYVDFEVNGAGNIEISGKCGTLNINFSGAGNFEGEDLKCEDVKVEINGVGNVEAYGSKSADLEINGMGNIDLYGNPEKVIKDKSLFSNITIHD
ncbi:MAG: DUF2807 domain-containing protein [Emcibacter sp.]|nr:DUF2807 domain-containing protein [Emcibacter sp.]